MNEINEDSFDLIKILEMGIQIDVLELETNKGEIRDKNNIQNLLKKKLKLLMQSNKPTVLQNTLTSKTPCSDIEIHSI